MIPLREESFGTIPVVLDGKIWRVFLIQHRMGKHWGFPKGHKEEGENSMEAALRELREETALGAKRFLHKDPFIEEYKFRKEGKLVIKKVSYYLIEAEGVYALDPKEIGDGRWFSLKEAFLQITFQETKEILSSVEKILLSLP